MNYRVMPNVDIALHPDTAAKLYPRNAMGLFAITVVLVGIALFLQVKSSWPLLLWAPIVEEAVFRLGLHAALKKNFIVSRNMLSASCLLTAICFGLAHAIYRGPLLGFAVVLPALCIGAVYERTERLMPCVALHMGFNLVWWLGASHIFSNSPLQF